MAHTHLRIAVEVEEAMRLRKPIVAFESALITHGLPYPHSIEVMRRCGDVARDAGAVPAFIALLEGTVIVGVSTTEMSDVVHNSTRARLGVRELAAAIATGASGGTTVAGSVAIAALCGAAVVVCGDIGGVNCKANGGVDTLASADLPQIAVHNVAVVCGGVQANCDPALTSQYLERHSIPVVGYRCDTFPLSYNRTIATPVGLSVDSVDAVANYLTIKWGMALRGGVVVVNPSLTEHSISALLYNNAQLGAQVAVRYAGAR